MAIDRAGVHIRQVAVPNLIGILGKFDACSIKIIILIEESDLYSGRMRRGQGKIDASAIPRSAETMRQTLTDLVFYLDHYSDFSIITPLALAPPLTEQRQPSPLLL